MWIRTIVGSRNGSRAFSSSLINPKSESYASKLGSGNVTASTALGLKEIVENNLMFSNEILKHLGSKLIEHRMGNYL